MRFILPFMAVALVAASASAEQQAPNWQALALGYRAQLQGTSDALVQVQTEAERLKQDHSAAQKREADLDAYLKSCGDKPGCTVPVVK